MAVTKSKRRIKEQLALATCSLLSQQAGAEAIESEWSFDSSLLHYSEDDRVSVTKGIFDLAGNLTDRDKIDFKVVLDTMTGSTPTGAVENSTVQTQTGVSGSGGFDASGSPTALAPFEDTRLAVNIDWDRDNSSRYRTSYGASISVEKDYTSIGGSFNLALDSSNKLTTYEFGIAGAFDTISQTGGETPDPLADVTTSEFYDEGERYTYDFLFGITRVLTKRTVWQNNLSYSVSDGYHTDPYKVISVVGNEGDRQRLIDSALEEEPANRGVDVSELPADVVTSIASNFANFEVEFTRLYESRPADRARSTYYSKLVTRLTDRQTMHVSYRYYSDDWDIVSHTLDYRHRLDFGKGRTYIEPQIRVYQQSAAEFFSRSLARGAPLPRYASADSRLDEVTGVTVGFKFGKKIGQNSELRLRITGMRWEAKNAVYKETDAVLFQVSLRLGFY